MPGSGNQAGYSGSRLQIESDRGGRQLLQFKDNKAPAEGAWGSDMRGKQMEGACRPLTGLVASLSLFDCFATASAAEGVRVGALHDWKIVLPANAIPSEEYAAEELQTFSEEAAGLDLPIAREVQEDDRGHISVGCGNAMKAAKVGFDTTDFGPEESSRKS